MARLWRVLAGHRDLRLLLSAGLISQVGDWILRVGLAYLVYDLTGSTLASAAALLASLLPQIVFGSVAGVYVDRWNRRRTMVVTNLLLALGLLPLLAVHDQRQVWIVYLVTAVESALAQFFIAAEAAVVPTLVPDRDLVTANALNGQNRDIARLVGAALGGVTVGLGGVTLLTLTDAASFGLAAAILALIRGPRDGTRPAAPRRHPLQEWADGARIALRTPALRVVLLFTLITGVGEAIMATLMAPFVRDVLHGTAEAYGLILSVQAAGGIAGGLAAAAVGHRVPPRRLLGWGAVTFGVLDLALFLYPLATPALWPAFAIMVAVGLPCALMVAGLVTVLQTATGDAYRGRVFGAASALQGAAMLAGTFLAGALGDRIGIVPVIATQGAGYCAAGLLTLLLLPRENTVRRSYVVT
jgi:Na+/melibiose symporter-like transporter